jgi:ParB family chromosome partitioning protein
MREQPGTSNYHEPTKYDSVFWVEVERIQPNPYQPRVEFDEERLKALAESIRQYGVLQPLVVTRSERVKDDGGLQSTYELIAGERRLRASKLAGIKEVPVVIRAGEQSDKMKLELAIIENLQREDLNAIDRAKALQQLAESFGLSHGEIGAKVGRSREYVSNSIRLLLLPEPIQQAVVAREISEGHARALLMLCDKPEEQDTLFREIVLKKSSVRVVEQLARRIATEKIRKHDKTPEMMQLEKSLTESLGTRVLIENRPNGGRLLIEFFSPDDLAHIANILAAREEARLASASDFADATPMPFAEPASELLESVQTSGIEPAPQTLAVAGGESGPLNASEMADRPVFPNTTPVETEIPTRTVPTQEEDLYSVSNFTL